MDMWLHFFNSDQSIWASSLQKLQLTQQHFTSYLFRALAAFYQLRSFLARSITFYPRFVESGAYQPTVLLSGSRSIDHILGRFSVEAIVYHTSIKYNQPQDVDLTTLNIMMQYYSIFARFVQLEPKDTHVTQSVAIPKSSSKT
jgi:hypothetical protein